MCALLYWAAGCTLIDYRSMTSSRTIQLPSGVQAMTSSIESIYNKYGIHALENGGDDRLFRSHC
jgi:hypothetical protein